MISRDRISLIFFNKDRLKKNPYFRSKNFLIYFFVFKKGIKMEVVLGKKAGFCFGVDNAIKKTEELLSKKDKIYCLGELVHNKQVVNGLESKGLVVINDVSDAKDSLIIRAHGEPKKTYEFLKEKNIKVYDFTCPMVLKIHEIVKKYSKEGYFVIAIGGKKHPESLGTISYCNDKYSYLAENEEDLSIAIKDFNESGIKKLLIVVQSTYNVDVFEKYLEEIKKNILDDVEIVFKNTICAETKGRQKETIELSKTVEAMIIIGGKNSSNTKELYNMASKNCLNTFIVETKDDLDMELIKKFNVVGVMAGASTPKVSIDEVVEVLKNI